MMTEMGLQRVIPDQSSGTGHTYGTSRHPSVIDPILSKRVCFYKSGDPQFNGLRMVINNRTFKTFDGLLDSLSKKVPLPFGVRNISTPRGIHAVCTLDELEDGKSYICSDRRKVKPINLALARKKLPPWYQARPVSSRRRTVQQARFFPGWSIHKQEPVVGRTPKRLQVFRNGDTTVKYTVVLQKRITPTFESILEYISDLIQFHVVKLHTLDGRRVDGLPGLILCSGTIVATGREPFKPANYNAQKAPPLTMPTTKRMSVRRLKRKKKTLSYSSKSRQFSPSSEMYIVNQIHNSITESSCDLPSNPTNSVDLDGGCVLESLAETEGNNCLDNGAGGQDCSLPTDDNIEKSFRVNQDGSMTVEMKVCLTIKEEETVHWTTTLTRSSVANQLNQTCLTEPEAEQEISSQESNSVKIQSPAASNDTINKDKTWDDNDQDPPSSCNGAFNESSNEEDDFNKQTGAVSPWRASSPGQKQITKKQTSVESIQSLSADGIQEGMVGSYCYREQTEYGAMAEQYCMVKQSSSRPVPKPRTLGSLDANNINSRNVSTFKSAGMTEIVHTESGGEEVTETFLHLYEQQTCRPATSGSGQLSSCNEFELDHCRPSTASESISVWKTESRSFTSDITLPSLKTVAVQARNAQQHIPKHAKGKDKPLKREVNNDKRIPLKPKVITKRVRWLKTPGKRPKEKSAETGGKRRKVKTFSSAGFIRKIYGSKLNSTKTTIKSKKGPTQNGERGHVSKSSQQSDDECITKDTEIPSAVIEDANEIEKSRLNVGLNEVSQQRGILTRQTSMYQEKNNGNDVSKSMPLLAFNTPISVTNAYVENWLEKSNPSPTDQPVVESKELVSDTLVQTENGRCWESKNKNVAEEVNYSKETSEIQTCRSLKTDPQPPENVLGASVKQRIKSFEIQPSSPSIDKAPVDQQNVHTTTTIKENNNSLAQNNIEKTKSFTNHICSGIYPSANNPSTEMPSGSDVENESRPINISLHEATPSDTLLMELPLPPPPPPVEYTELENTEYCMMDVSSVASSPLYRLSSESSQMSDNHPLSLSPTSDRAISTTDHTMEMTTSIQTDIPSVLGNQAPLPRAASIKRAPLVSKISFDRKMSLRKACLDKYTLCSDATSETTTLSTHINKGGDNVLQNGICSTGIQQPSEIPPDEIQQANSILDLNSLAYCTSASPTIPTSEERTLSDSILSSKASTLSDLALTEPKTNESPVVIEKGASSPKPLVKKVKRMSSQSPERKSQTKKFSSEPHHNSPKLSSSQNHIPDETMSPNIAMRRDETPNASPSTETKQTPYEPKLQERRSPYSQSLDIVSPSVKHKSSRKLLSRDLSSDNLTESTNGSPRKTLSERKRQQTPQSTKSTAELDKTLTSITLMSVKADQSDDIEVNKTDKLITDQEESMRETQMPQPLNMANQPNMTPVLEEICYSIKSIRHISQNKRPSCLEKSNSMPDFSSHVASTFGSSTKTLLAFLSVMTLKASLTNPNMDQLNANNVSCAEALKMIDSLKEIARIEDSHELKDSLSKLQQSASTHLLQSWRGFQELSDTCKSRSSTPKDPEQELVNKAEKDCGIDENVIDEIMDNLGIPRKLKEELSSFSLGVKSDSDDKENMSGGTIVKISENSNNDITQDEKAYVDVSSIIKKFTDIDQPKQSSRGSITETVKHKTTDRANKDQDSQYVQKLTKCTLAESEERQLNSTVLLVKETEESMQSCSDTVKKENLRKEKQQSDSEDQSNQEKANMIAVSRIETQDSLTSEVDERDMEDQLLMNSEESMSIPENELNESRSEQEGKNMSSAFKDLEQKVNRELSLSSSQAGEQLANSTEEDSEVECEEIHQESRESDELPISESQIEEKHDKQQSSNYFVELNSRETESISSPYSENKSLSEEEQLEVQFQELSNKDTLSKTASPSDLDREQQSQAVCTILKPEVDCEEIFQESRESDYLSNPESQIEEQEEKQQSSTYFEKRNVNETERISSTDSLSKSSSGEELEVEFKELSSKEYSSILARLSNLEQEQQSQAVCKILKPEGEFEEIHQESDKSSTSESQVEEEEDKKPSSNYFVKLNLRETESISSPESENKSLSEEEQLEVQFQELSNKYTLSKTASPSDLDREQQSQASCTILKPEVDCEEIFQESRESDYLSNPESQIEEQEEKQQSSTYFEERNVNETERISSTDSLSKSSSEEELEVEFKELNSKEYLSSLARLSHLEEEQQSQAVCKILKPEGECEEIRQESDKSSISESQVEEEEDKKTTSNDFVEFNSREKEGISSENKSLSEEEQLEVPFQELSNKDTLSENASPSYLDREQQNQAVCTILKVECEKIFQERRESEYLSNPESQIEEQEEKQQSSTYFAEIISSPDSLMKSSEEEEELEVEFKELNRKEYLPNHARLTHLEQEQEQSPAGCMVLNVSVNDSTCNSDEEVHTIECKQPQVIHEERTKIDKVLKASIEETEEDKVSTDDEDHLAYKTHICDEIKSQNRVEGDLSNFIENQNSYTKKDSSHLIQSNSLSTHYESNADEDSGNDHSSCEEHFEIEQIKVEDKQISHSIEEELNYDEKEYSSDEEHAKMDSYIEEDCTEYQEALTTDCEVTKYDKAEENLKQQPENIISPSVAKRIILLEKQVADAQKINISTEKLTMRRFSQINVPLESDVEDTHSESQSALGNRSAPQSSLSFSYDSSNVITTEPEGNRVRSIREMFLAKCPTDIQHEHRCFPSPNASQLPELRAQTSVSAGYQSQTSSELSSGEDDSPRKTITKGFVRRTIERLYGKKDANPDEEASEMPPSVMKPEKKEYSSIFSPFHTARSKAVSELSYFNSALALDTLSESARCLVFNSQVGPVNSALINNGEWLLKENTVIRKSVSDPVGINKTFTNSPQDKVMCEDTEECSPYSHFNTKSELEDKKKSFSGKCTYFSLPHASDSEPCQDELSTVSKSIADGDSLTDTKVNSEDTKMCEERNSMLPSGAITDFKMMDNKVHPLVKIPSDREVVDVQPGKGQGALNRRLGEPDMLDILYDFCGQNCPFL